MYASMYALCILRKLVQLLDADVSVRNKSGITRHTMGIHGSSEVHLARKQIRAVYAASVSTRYLSIWTVGLYVFRVSVRVQRFHVIFSGDSVPSTIIRMLRFWRHTLGIHFQAYTEVFVLNGG